MKMRLLAGLLALLLLCPVATLGASSVTQTWTVATKDVSILTFSWTADTDGSVTSTASDRAVDGFVVLVVTDPGTPAPTAGYDIALEDADGVDIMGHQLEDRGSTDSEHAVPWVRSQVAPQGRWVSGFLTLVVEHNAVSGAQGEVKVFIRR